MSKTDFASTEVVVLPSFDSLAITYSFKILPSNLVVISMFQIIKPLVIVAYLSRIEKVADSYCLKDLASLFDSALQVDHFVKRMNLELVGC